MLLKSEAAKNIISIILGLGFASLFKKVCNKEHCRIIKGPNIKTIEKNIYRIDDKCFKYKPEATACDH